MFILPKDRLKYYKKLYSRLLKSTQPGRSDHRLLTGALDKLDGLLSTVDQRSNLKIGDNFGAPPPTLAPTTEDEVVIDMRSRNSNGLPPKNFMVGPPSNRDSDSTGAGSVSSRCVHQVRSCPLIWLNHASEDVCLKKLHLRRRTEGQLQRWACLSLTWNVGYPRSAL